MIRSFRLALAQLNPTVGDIEGNTARTIEYVERGGNAAPTWWPFPNSP